MTNNLTISEEMENVLNIFVIVYYVLHPTR